MKPFEYISCTTLAEACAAIESSGEGGRVLAGGTDLLVELRGAGNRSPDAIVDISRIATLKGITKSGASILVGPLTTHTELTNSSLIRQSAGLLGVAAATIGSQQIRNRGTVGGNIMNAATCADTVPPLLALGARLTLVSNTGTREVDIADFFVEPYKTHARYDEVLSSISFAPLTERSTGAFLKLGRRNAVAISRLSVAAILTLDREGIIADARIVAGAAMPVWERISLAEQLLLGQKPSTPLFDMAGRKASEAMIRKTGRRWSTEYKEPVLAVMVRRALETCSGA